jgi:RHS repeat-associated protein
VERSVFTGHIYDNETDLYNAKARYFDPKLGRFLTQDSYLGQIDEPPSLHRYVYGNDNPTTFVDPTGHASVQAGRIEGFAEQDLKTLAGYDPAQAPTQVLESPKEAHARTQAKADTARRAKLEKGAAERLARLGELNEAGFSHYANITIEESDFVNGRLDRAKVLAAVEQQVGTYAASEAPWLVDALLGGLRGAKAGATVDVSEVYSAAYAVSAAKAHQVAAHEAAAGGYAYMGAMLGQRGAAPADLVTDAGFGIANAGMNDVMLALGGYAAIRGLAGAAVGFGREVAAARRTFMPGELLPDGRVAGEGPGAALGRPMFQTSVRGPSGGRSVGQRQGREFRTDWLEVHEFDPKVPRHIRGWLKQERLRVEAGRATAPRNPPGQVMAHGRTTPAREGFDYSNSRLQDADLNALEEAMRRRLGKE